MSSRRCSPALFALLAAPAIWGCNDSSSSSAPPAPSASVAVPASSAAGSSPAPSPGTAAAGSPTKPDASPTDPRESVVRAWNDALTRHDLDALAKVYAAHVLFYGTSMTRDACVAAKKQAFERTPDYRQTLRDDRVRMDPVDADHVRAHFTKISSVAHKDQAYEATLLLVREGGDWRIGEETDSATDRALARSCDTAVGALASTTKPAQEFLNTPVSKEALAAGFISRGWMVFPPPAPGAPYSVAFHSNFPDHMANELFVDVDPKTGAASQADGTEPLKVHPALQAAVVAACK
jgi:ketosteroid isomerase-like protein